MDATYKFHVTSEGKFIHVFDNVFDWQSRQYIYAFARKECHYHCNNIDFDTFGRYDAQEGKFRCNLNQNQINQLSFFEQMKCPKLTELISGHAEGQIYFNLGVPSDVNKIHTDLISPLPNYLSLVYYVNPDWEIDWGGETMFYNSDCTDIEFASAFKPGRAIVFDSTIPHCARSQSASAKAFRFTLAMKLAPPLL